MLSDRDYMRDPYRRGSLSMTAWLMIAIVVAFVLQAVVRTYMPQSNANAGLFKYFALSGPGLRQGYFWQLLTFQFLHGGPTHLLFNLLGLWFIGRTVEHFLGATRYLYVYFIGGISGGVLQGLLSLAFPGAFGDYVVGASAGLSALLAVFCLMAPQAELRVMFVIPLKAIWVYWSALAIALFFTLVPPGDGIAHAAHLGGLLFATLFISRGWHQDFRPLPGIRWWQALTYWMRRYLSPGSRPTRTASAPPAKETVPPRASRPRVSRSAANEQEFMSREVDPILDKIAAHGIHSLTDREREILENARKKMGR